MSQRDRGDEVRERLEEFALHQCDPLYAVFRRTLGDSESAQDLLQDTLLEAWRNLGRYDPSRPLRAWIFRIGQNRLRNFLRRRRLERRWVGPLEDGAGPPVLLDAAAGLLERERRDELEEALLKLPHRQRYALLLRYQEGLSCAEIAEALEATAGAVSMLLHHARRALKGHLGGKLVENHR